MPVLGCLLLEQCISVNKVENKLSPLSDAYSISLDKHSPSQE